MDGRIDGHYQVHYLLASRAIVIVRLWKEGNMCGYRHNSVEHKDVHFSGEVTHHVHANPD